LTKNDDKKTEAKPENGKTNGGLDRMVNFLIVNRKLEFEG
jgi:hypothetical protein